MNGWNPQLFASEGYVVSLINPRGSTGYGQKFTDQISGDWGGKCYTDLMRGIEYLAGTYPFIDKDRMAALGASFGGFMVNWIAGHPHPFKAFVSHDGIFKQETMSYMTEELWFDIWEHGGMPHDNRKGFQKFSPHLLVNNYKTPMLVIQGEQDFRCPVSEGISLFTALQVKGIPSKFLYFPDEGHWVLKPANSQVWYRTVLDFLREHLE
jgi:dipeptidyl aminopeptidase/acylaminoacyl peptidase